MPADDSRAQWAAGPTGERSTLAQAPNAYAAASGPAWDRLSEQLDWYERKSAHHKLWFQGLKVVQIVVAALIPVVAAAGASAAVAGALGAVIVILEGLQQLFQFQQNWIAYRGTAEALKHEKHLYVVGAGDYAREQRRDALLAERVEALVSQEHAAWASTMRDRASTGDEHR